MINLDPNTIEYPPFSLHRLLKTVFEPEGGEKVAIFIDLDDPTQVKDFAFLNDASLTVQKYAYEVFHKAFERGELHELGLSGGEVFAYKTTGGSNLDLPDEGYNTAGEQVSFEKDVYPNYDIILCVSTYSATAPLTAHAKQFGFKGATLHGLNEVILNSGLSIDYNHVSSTTEALRLGMTKADAFEIDFVVKEKTYTLKLVCNGQEAQKSHGICRGKEPDVANLPAGEVYYVPEGAEGDFPMLYEDGTLGIMKVSGGRIQHVELLEGSQATIEEHNAKLKSDPMTGELGELGFGSQIYPVSGRDIQDEKILGTVHVATGRSDHLGGHLTPDLFNEHQNASHDDILFAPFKTKPIHVAQVRMFKDGQVTPVIENYKPTSYLTNLLD